MCKSPPYGHVNMAGCHRGKPIVGQQPTEDSYGLGSTRRMLRAPEEPRKVPGSSMVDPTTSTRGEEMKTFQGKATYENEEGPGFVEFAYVDGKDLIDMMQEAFGVEWEDKTVRVTIEEVNNERNQD